MDSLRDVMEQPILRLRFDSPASARQACDSLAVERDLQVSVDGDEVHVAGNPTPGVVLSRLGSHVARLEAVDRSRMPLQELISRLMRGGPPRPARTSARRPAGGTRPPGPAPRPVPPATSDTASWRGASWRPAGPPATPGGRANGVPNSTTNGATNGAANGADGRGWQAHGSWADGTWGNGNGNGSSGNGSRPW
jgi:hypothetical protein